jgi:hypothetical protein
MANEILIHAKQITGTDNFDLQVGPLSVEQLEDVFRVFSQIGLYPDSTDDITMTVGGQPYDPSDEETL